MAAYVAITPDTPVDLERRHRAPIRIGSRTTIPRSKQAPRAVPVPGVARPIVVKIASEMTEWEQAFRLVSANYQAIGAEPLNPGAIRFTPYHALPDTATFVALENHEVLATMTLVLDNTLLGLPAESLYPDEIEDLRRAGRCVVEVTSLADRDLSTREFIPVFVALARLMTHYAIAQGADALVITCRPRHGNFYRKLMGFQPFGPCRAYPAVQNYPTEANLLDVPLLRTSSPAMYERIIEDAPPPEALRSVRIPPRLVRLFANRSSLTNEEEILNVVSAVECLGNSRRWEVTRSGMGSWYADVS
jgi:hypothetical protein